MPTICLSAGHGNGDPGAINKDLQEATLTRIVTVRAAEMIRKHSVDCLEVPENLDLVGTIKWINDRAEQITICIEQHFNIGGNGKGVEAWNYAGAGNESDKLSQFLVDAVSAETGLINRGIKDESANRWGKLGFVHDTDPVAALIECAFLDGDYDYLKKDENLTRIAKGVARGALSYLKIAWKPELINPVQPTPPPPPPVLVVTEDTVIPQIRGMRVKDIKLRVVESEKALSQAISNVGNAQDQLDQALKALAVATKNLEELK